MQTPLATPVPVLRLPRGPDGSNQGFAPDGRRAPPKPEVPEVPEPPESRESREQQARASLRERYLRSLLAMVGRPVCFTLHEGVHETHVHRVGDAIQPSHPLSCPSPPAPNPSQHQSLFQ